MKKLNSILDIHADDYALSPNSDSDIINLCKLGKLNSISIIPNLNFFNLSVQNFLKEKKSFPNEIKVSVHTNVMEGKCCYSNPSELPHLVNTKGYFITSWGKLFVQNYIPFLRNKIKIELKKEIIAQIETCINANVINSNGIRIDSHQHPHMIPLFYEAIFEALDEKKYSVEYIRNTIDPISFYKNNRTDSIANIIKCLILNHYSRRLSRFLKKRNLPDSYLLGVYFSGKMDERIIKTIPVFCKKADKKNRIVELLFHPGLMLNDELNDDFTKEGFNEFHLSENRHIEYKTVKNLKVLI